MEVLFDTEVTIIYPQTQSIKKEIQKSCHKLFFIYSYKYIST